MWIFILLGAAASTSAMFESFWSIEHQNCTNGQFMCRNGKCIFSKLRCDDKNDCGDNSDEIDCDLFFCKEPAFFRCRNKRCIPKDFVCNDEDDCEDFSDETNCNHTKLFSQSKSTCNTDEWQCNDKLCIPIEWVCNDMKDCLDGSDETESTCLSKYFHCDTFKCKNGHCIPTQWRCDGTPDCSDKSDEENCNHHVPIEHCTLDNRKFLCGDNTTCIDLDHVCDKNFHCPDHSDEGKLCNSSSNNCINQGCHECHQLPSGPRCLCSPGYKSDGGKNCTDINECEQFGICDQKCENTPGSYKCSCDEKYNLSDDKRTCKVAGGEAIMVFGTRSEIRGYMLESNVYFSMVKNLSMAVGVHYDGDHVYWTDVFYEQESIMRSNVDGSNKEALVTSGLGSPEDLAIDWLTGNIYFTDAEYQHIGVCSSEGSHCSIIVNKEIGKPRGIVLNVEEGDMYWTDWDKHSKIAHAYMDGSNDGIFLDSDIYWPNSLALDFFNRRLYWCDAKKQTLESIDLNGNNRKVILKGMTKHPYGIAVFENTLYWSDWHTKSVESCNKFTGKNRETVAKENDVVYSINIFHSSFQRRSVNPCSMAFCSDLCVLKAQSYACVCPQHKALGGDRHICREIKSKQELIAGYKNILVRIEHQTLGKHMVTNLPLTVKEIGTLTYDSYNNLLLISDVATKKIVSYNLDTLLSHVLDIPNLGKVTSMDYDSNGNNLYIYDEFRKAIEVINTITFARKILLETSHGEHVTSIALVPNEGVMFVAFKKMGILKSHLDRFTMDGKNRVHVLEVDLFGPVHLHYDNYLHRIVVADSTGRKIEFVHPDGHETRLFRNLSNSPVTLTSLDNHLFWMESYSNRLFWADKTSDAAYTKKVLLDLPDKPGMIHLISAVQKSEIVTGACQLHNDCSHLCLMSHKTKVCACPSSWILSNDNRTCVEEIHCDSSEFSCWKSTGCISKKMKCDGKKDCTFGEDEDNCGEVKKCPRRSFQCDNGDCIEASQYCNHNYDCKDKSDESNCDVKNKRCPPGKFTCDNRECILDIFVCNGIADCADSSDERNCSSRHCDEHEFRCDSGACIPASWECDHDYDCGDFSDEHSSCATLTCPTTSFACTTNGRCIDQELVCDGDDDCGDNSDEIHCKFRQQVTDNILCKPGEFSCISNTSICLTPKDLCNGIGECPKNEDEELCTSCRDEEFKCKNNKCIATEWLCDKHDDCGDNSDEENAICSENKKTDGSILKLVTSCDNSFKCKSGDCINYTLVCNENIDCIDGSDEGKMCDKACDKNPCEHDCIKTPFGAMCRCRDGYELDGDGYSCADKNECTEEPQKCAQLCHNTNGGFDCDCFDGFLLGTDKKSCKAQGQPMSIIFTVDGQIRELSLKTNMLTLLYSTAASNIIALEVLNEPRTVYVIFEDAPDSIHQINFENKTRLYMENMGRPLKIAVDWSSNNIYYYDGDIASKSVKVCNFNKNICSKLFDVDMHKQVTEMVVDSVNKILFIVLNNLKVFDAPNFAIHKYNLDGSDKKEVVKTSPGFVNSLTFDHNKRLLYYSDRRSERIYQVDYKGTSNTVVFHNITSSYSMKFYQDHLYISNGGGRMTKCKLFANKLCLDFKMHGSSSHLFGIIQESLQPDLKNICDINNCSFICLPKNYDDQSCLCPDGRLEFESNKCNNDFNERVFMVHSVSLEDGTSVSSATVAVSILIPLAFVVAVVTLFLKRRRSNIVNIFGYSMHLNNPCSKKNRTSLLNKHEYENPVFFEASPPDDNLNVTFQFNK